MELKYRRSEFERRHHALFAVICIYGIELLTDNIAECRANVLQVLAEYLNVDESDELYRGAFYVLVAESRTRRRADYAHPGREPICFAEWGYLGKGKFQRRDFRLDTLTESDAWSAEGSLFTQLGRHNIFQPVQAYPPQTVRELAALGAPEGVA